MEIAGRIGSAEGESFGFGRDAGRQLINQMGGLEKSIEGHQKSAKTAEGYGDQVKQANHLYMALTQIDQLEHVRIKSAETLLDLQKQVRNEQESYGRSLLTMGPGQLMQQIAASRMSKGGISGAGFFAMNAEMRQSMMNMPQFSDSSRALGFLRRNLPPQYFRPDNSINTEGLQGDKSVSGKLKEELYAAVGKLAPKHTPQMEIAESARSAASGLSAVATSAIAAAKALDAVANRGGGGQLDNQTSNALPPAQAGGVPSLAMAQPKWVSDPNAPGGSYPMF